MKFWRNLKVYMKLNSKTIKTIILVDLIVCICAGIFGILFFKLYLSTSWKNDAMPYLSKNEELICEIGIVEKVKYRGMHKCAEADGRPVYFEVTTERGEFFVILWMDTLENNSNEFFVTKHLVTTEDDILL